MKRLLSLLLLTVMLVSTFCLASCMGKRGDDQAADDTRSSDTYGDSEVGSESDTESDTTPAEHPATVVRTFAAIYDQTVTVGETPTYMNGRALMYLFDDGALKIYVCFKNGAVKRNAVYNGSYKADGDSLSLEYTVSDGYTEKLENVNVQNGVFDARFYMLTSMTASSVRFYELSPIADDGALYIGYFSKTVGSNSITYVYSLGIKDDQSFEGGGVRFENTNRYAVSLKGTRTERLTYSVMLDDREIVAEKVTADIETNSEDAFDAALPIDATGTYVPKVTFIKVN